MIGPLTNHLWQTTAFALAVGLLTLAFRRNRAKVRYALWFGASLKFLIPFWLLMILGGHLPWTPAAQKLAAQVAPPSVSLTAEEVSQPFPAALPPAQSLEKHDWLPLAISSIWL